MPAGRPRVVGLLLAGLFVAVLLLPVSARPGGPSVPADPRAELGPPHPVAPAPGGVPSLVWGMAYIVYGPGDDTTHVFGEGAGMVAYDPGWNLTLFGGEGSGGLTNATSNYNSTTGEFTWVHYDPSPSARANFSFATVPSKGFAVLFGGLTNLTTQSTSNETWLYWFGNQSWENVSHARAPPARESAGFAVNDSGSVGLLEGGWSPRASVGNSTATVFWNDTWQLNLTSFDWTELRPGSAPPPLMGSGLVYDTAASRFDLFGGCTVQCSNALWVYGGSPGRWTPVAQVGAVPSPRAAAAFAYDALDSVDLLFGGFVWGTNGPTALGDTFSFDPGAGRWTELTSANGPGPRFDAPSTWAQYPGCTGLNVVGGSPSLAAPPTNASVLEPLAAPGYNCWPDLYTGVGGPPPPACSITGTPVDLEVSNALTGVGLANASVDLLGHCVDRTVVTNAAGYANISLPSPDTVNFSTVPPGFHPGRVGALIAPNVTNHVLLSVDPLPGLRVRSFGIGETGAASPLYNVSVALNGSVILGRTNAAGYLNVSRLSLGTGSLALAGSLANHSTDATNVTIPYTGDAYANLSLLDPGPVSIDVVDAISGVGISGATGRLVPFGAATPYPVPFTTGPNGSYFDPALAAGNFSVSVSAAGFLSATLPLSHPWARLSVLIVPLAAEVGTNLSVLLLNARTGGPIAGGTVVVGNASVRSVATSSADGWANLSDLLPPGLTAVLASASGFASNLTYVTLGFHYVIPRYVVELTPSSSCLSVACPPPATQSVGSGPFGFLPGGALAGRVLLVVAPAVVLAMALAYLLLPARRREGAGPGGASR